MGTGNGWGRVCDNTNHFGYHIKDINMNIEGGGHRRRKILKVRGAKDTISHEVWAKFL